MIYGPTTIQTRRQPFEANTDFVRPLKKKLRSSGVSNKALSSEMILLFRQCSINRPFLQTFRQGVITNTKLIRPIHKAKFLSIKLHEAIMPGVSILFSSRRPSAIPGRIGTIVVESINRQSSRNVSIGELARDPSIKRWEGTPLIANRYPTPAVVGVGTIVGVQTSLLNSDPHFVYAGLIKPMCFCWHSKNLAWRDA